jgi:electron transfer flavoprotein alpha subunit
MVISWLKIFSLVAELGKGYSHILAPPPPMARTSLPRVAACLDVNQISEITKVGQR